MTTIKQFLITASRTLSDYSDSARLDAELLLLKILAKPRTFLFSHPEYSLTQNEIEQVTNLLELRQQGTPIAHILGQQEFWSLPLMVTPDTLIPRADTEILVEQALLKLKTIEAPIVFDLGTGTGAIALAIASERPDAQVYASDTSSKALKVAQQNIESLAINNIQLLKSDWLNQFSKLKADLIVSNPPYIGHDCQLIENNVKTYEPHSALFSKQNGYKDLLTIISQSKYHLRPCGTLLLEHGLNQELILNKALVEAGFKQISNHKDLADINRCVCATI